MTRAQAPELQGHDLTLPDIASPCRRLQASKVLPKFPRSQPSAQDFGSYKSHYEFTRPGAAVSKGAVAAYSWAGTIWGPREKDSSGEGRQWEMPYPVPLIGPNQAHGDVNHGLQSAIQGPGQALHP